MARRLAKHTISKAVRKTQRKRAMMTKTKARPVGYSASSRSTLLTTGESSSGLPLMATASREALEMSVVVFSFSRVDGEPVDKERLLNSVFWRAFSMLMVAVNFLKVN